MRIHKYIYIKLNIPKVLILFIRLFNVPSIHFFQRSLYPSTVPLIFSSIRPTCLSFTYTYPNLSIYLSSLSATQYKHLTGLRSKRGQRIGPSLFVALNEIGVATVIYLGEIIYFVEQNNINYLGRTCKWDRKNPMSLKAQATKSDKSITLLSDIF